MNVLLVTISVVTICTAFITTTQAYPCQVIPENYTFNRSQVDRLNNFYSCSNDTAVLTCQTPNVLTDFNTGSTISYDHYFVLESNFRFNILFTFQTEIILTNIILYYYTNQFSSTLPGLRLYAVPDNYELESELYNYTLLHTVSPKEGRCSHCRAIEYIDISSPTSTKKVLLSNVFIQHNYFALSEVMFFADNGYVAETNNTSSATTVQYQDTTVYDHFYQSTDNTTETTTFSPGIANESSAISVWLLVVAAFGLLFLGLLVVCIVTCTWCACKKWKKKKRKSFEPTPTLAVQDNPCYGPVKKLQGTDTDAHVYDTVPVHSNINLTDRYM